MSRPVWGTSPPRKEVLDRVIPTQLRTAWVAAAGRRGTRCGVRRALSVSLPRPAAPLGAPSASKGSPGQPPAAGDAFPYQVSETTLANGLKVVVIPYDSRSEEHTSELQSPPDL